MTSLGLGDVFPEVKISDIDGQPVEFPLIFAEAPATIFFCTEAGGDRGAGPW